MQQWYMDIFCTMNKLWTNYIFCKWTNCNILQMNQFCVCGGILLCFHSKTWRWNLQDVLNINSRLALKMFSNENGCINHTVHNCRKIVQIVLPLILTTKMECGEKTMQLPCSCNEEVIWTFCSSCLSIKCPLGNPHFTYPPRLASAALIPLLYCPV